MMAASERAPIRERHRRGTRHAARAGIVHVLSGAPDGDRDSPKAAGRGQAHDDVVPEEARVVRQGFDGGGRARWTIGAVCRRLTRAGEGTRTGKTIWERRVVWGMLPHPASRGAAACGKTRQGPRQPRLRAQRGRPVQPQRAVSSADVPAAAWRRIPGPAMITPERFEAVQEPWREHQRHARPSRRGARYGLQGVVQCGHGSYAYDGKRLSPRARKGHPRAYADDRCLGTDAYRVGGERVCPTTQGRTDRLDLAVWQDVWALRAHPERLAEEYRRRGHADSIMYPKNWTGA